MQDKLTNITANFVNTNDFRGYKQSQESKIDTVLAHIGPGTPCGEYFRRYWHPITLSAEVGKDPKELKILGLLNPFNIS